MLATDPDRCDVHVRPPKVVAERRVEIEDHSAAPWCWCQPRLEFEDPATRRRVYVHKKES